VRVLLDTHALLWFLLDDPRLSRVARDVIADGHNRPEISPASYWEIAIKISLGKYLLPEPLGAFMDRELKENDMRILPILPHHVAALTDLPFHHKDPSDRLIIAQAMVEGIALLSCDGAFDAYPVQRIWAGP
jgi:PIN domain nuclease of toxin-antitoxin system